MQNRIYTGATQHRQRMVSERHRPCRQPVNIANGQIVWMFVVATQHYPLGVSADKTMS